MEGHFHFILNGKDLKKKTQKSIILKDFFPSQEF